MARNLVLNAAGDVVDVVSGIPPAEAYAFAFTLLASTPELEASGVWVGWRRQAGKFVPPSTSIQPLTPVDTLLAYAAARRYELETAGVTMPNGAVIKTDRESQNLINGARDLAKEDPDEPIRFKTGPGTFVTVDSPAMILIALVVGRHVRDLFAREETAALAIKAGTASSIADVDRILAGG